ncbi:MAG: hypothetical protein WDN44_03365 [Sphingomonas sp.]
MITRRQSLALIGGTAAGLALAGCGGKPARRDLVFATQKNGVPFLAETRGEFATRLGKRGIGPVKWVEFASGPPLIEAIRAGAVDIGLVGDAPVIYALAAAPTSIMSRRSAFPAWSAAACSCRPSRRRGRCWRSRASGSPIPRAPRRSSCSPRRSSRWGLGLNDIVVANLAPGDAQTALANGSVDAWAVWDPFFTLAQLRGGARRIPLPASDLDTVSYYVASGASCGSAPTCCAPRSTSCAREAAWGNAHRTYYRDQVAKATRLPPEVLDGMMAQYKDFLFGVDPVSPAIVANEQRVGDYLFEAGVIPKRGGCVQGGVGPAGSRPHDPRRRLEGQRVRARDRAGRAAPVLAARLDGGAAALADPAGADRGREGGRRADRGRRADPPSGGEHRAGR